MCKLHIRTIGLGITSRTTSERQRAALKSPRLCMFLYRCVGRFSPGVEGDWISYEHIFVCTHASQAGSLPFGYLSHLHDGDHRRPWYWHSWSRVVGTVAWMKFRSLGQPLGGDWILIRIIEVMNRKEGFHKKWHQKRVFENFLIVVSYPVNVSSIQVKIVKYCIFTIKTTHKFPEIELESTTLISFSILIEIGLTRCAGQFSSTAYPRIAIANPTPTSCCNLRESKLSNNLK